jgi:hypothetical protein
MDAAHAIAPPFALLTTAQARELDWIAALGKASEHARHRAALDQVLGPQHGHLHEDQLWFPYEVIERGAMHCESGHEREFVLCTLVVFLAAADPGQVELDLGLHFDDHAMAYESLPPVLRDVVLDAFETVRG